MTSTSFGILTALDPTQPAARAVDAAVACEAHGFDTLWLWDTWYAKDAYIGLTLAAQRTRALRLGPGVAATPVRHPAVLVNTIATLDEVSGGRAILGVGSGGQATVGRLGMRKASIARFREDLRIMRTLLAGEQIAEGRALYRCESVRRPMPIYVAAWGPRMLETSAELADGVIIMGPDDPQVLRTKMEQIRAAASRIGRDPHEVKIVFGVTCAYGEDPAPLVQKYKSLAIHHTQRVGYEHEYPQRYRPMFEQIRAQVATIAFPEGEAPRTDLVPDDFVQYSFVVGTEAQCLERLRTLLALEPDELVFSTGWVDVEHIEKLAALVAKL